MDNLRKLIRPNILSLQPYSTARNEFSGRDGIFLDANESPFGKWNRYPDPEQLKLKQQLAHTKAIDIETLFLGNGSDEIIDLCFRLFCEPGKDAALTFVPTYGMYQVSAAINNVELLQIPLDENFQIDTATVLPFLNDKNLKLIFICSPNNPTGNSIDRIGFILENFKGIVVVDEAYIDFSIADSLSTKLRNYPNLIVLQTLSKAWGLASLRIGLAIANPVIISFLNKIKPPYNISQSNQDLALSIVNDRENFDKKTKIIRQQREVLRRNLLDVDFVIAVYPSQTNFLLVKVTDAHAVYKHLINRNIIIRNRDNVLKSCLRITVVKPKENSALISALKSIQL